MPVPRITKEELKKRLENSSSVTRPTILDVRLKYPYEHSTLKLPGAIRMPPGEVSTAALPRDADVVVYDSDPDEFTSSHVAAQLIRQGIRAVALKGGFADWISANYPVEPKDPANVTPPQQS
jgi:rhodanese-related sulfurtransferase